MGSLYINLARSFYSQIAWFILSQVCSGWQNEDTSSWKSVTNSRKLWKKISSQLSVDLTHNFHLKIEASPLGRIYETCCYDFFSPICRTLNVETGTKMLRRFNEIILFLSASKIYSLRISTLRNADEIVGKN